MRIISKGPVLALRCAPPNTTSHSLHTRTRLATAVVSAKPPVASTQRMYSTLLVLRVHPWLLAARRQLICLNMLRMQHRKRRWLRCEPAQRLPTPNAVSSKAVLLSSAKRATAWPHSTALKLTTKILLKARERARSCVQNMHSLTFRTPLILVAGVARAKLPTEIGLPSTAATYPAALADATPTSM